MTTELYNDGGFMKIYVLKKWCSNKLELEGYWVNIKVTKSLEEADKYINDDPEKDYDEFELEDE